MKVVSVPSAGVPEDVKARGLPASTIVMDEHGGHVKAIVNARLLTALRNAAGEWSAREMSTVYPSELCRTSVNGDFLILCPCLSILGSLLSARLLLSSHAAPTSIVAIGAGAQIQAHVSLFLTAYPTIRTCNIFNRSRNARLQALCDRIRSRFPGVQVSSGIISPAQGQDGPSIRECIGKANIIVTATSSKEPLFPSEYVRAGTHLCLIGSYTPEMLVLHLGLCPSEAYAGVMQARDRY